MSLTLLVLAAGMGSRFGGLKQFTPVGPNNQAILDYSLFDAHRAGFTKAVLVIRPEMEEEVRQRVCNRAKLGVSLVHQRLDNIPAGWKIPSERKKPWGTAQAVLSAAESIDGPFVIINADDLYGSQSYKLIAEYFRDLDNPDMHAMIGYELACTVSAFGSVSRGVCLCDADNNLKEVIELTKIHKSQHGIAYIDEQGQEKKLSGKEIVSMNFWGFSPSIFCDIRNYFERFLTERSHDPSAECYLPAAINDAIAGHRAKVKVLPNKDPWFGLTYKEDLPGVTSHINDLTQKGKYPADLWH